jgi:hypothetical protein
MNHETFVHVPLRDYNELIANSITKKGLELLQQICTYYADTVPVKWGWACPDPKPWRCKLTVEVSEPGREWYCDKCPAQEICPSDDKEYSK